MAADPFLQVTLKPAEDLSAAEHGTETAHQIANSIGSPDYPGIKNQIALERLHCGNFRWRKTRERIGARGTCQHCRIHVAFRRVRDNTVGEPVERVLVPAAAKKLDGSGSVDRCLARDEDQVSDPHRRAEGTGRDRHVRGSGIQDFRFHENSRAGIVNGSKG